MPHNVGNDFLSAHSALNDAHTHKKLYTTLTDNDVVEKIHFVFKLTFSN